MRLTHTQHLLQQNAIGQHCLTQAGPILPFAACNDIVNRGQGEILMREVTMDHSVIIQRTPGIAKVFCHSAVGSASISDRVTHPCRSTQRICVPKLSKYHRFPPFDFGLKFVILKSCVTNQESKIPADSRLLTPDS